MKTINNENKQNRVIWFINGGYDAGFDLLERGEKYLFAFNSQGHSAAYTEYIVGEFVDKSLSLQASHKGANSIYGFTNNYNDKYYDYIIVMDDNGDKITIPTAFIERAVLINEYTDYSFEVIGYSDIKITSSLTYYRKTNTVKADGTVDAKYNNTDIVSGQKYYIQYMFNDKMRDGVFDIYQVVKANFLSGKESVDALVRTLKGIGTNYHFNFNMSDINLVCTSYSTGSNLRVTCIPMSNIIDVKECTSHNDDEEVARFADSIIKEE